MPEKLLLVEGSFDKYFIEELLRKTTKKVGEIDIESFQKKDGAGIKPYEEGISTLLKNW